MSGFVALLRTDGAPVEPDELGRLTASLGARGPDGSGAEERSLLVARLPVERAVSALGQGRFQMCR